MTPEQRQRVNDTYIKTYEKTMNGNRAAWEIDSSWCHYCGAIRFDPNDSIFCTRCERALDITQANTKAGREWKPTSLIVAYRRLGQLQKTRDALHALQILKREIRMQQERNKIARWHAAGRPL